MATIVVKRIYELPHPDDGYRVLVDRIWPRGVSKEQAKLDEWLKDIAPSNELRTWFNHQEERFQHFTEKYSLELKEKKALLDQLSRIAENQKLCLLYGAKDEIHNQAQVIRTILLTYRNDYPLSQNYTHRN
jgi:uncharacterized protein YeaO (DUF488 family)